MWEVHSILNWKTVSAEIRMYFVLQLSSALKKIHQEGFLHRDLKPHNVLLDADGDIKLADFGGTKDVASIQTNSDQTGVFTNSWADANARAGKYSKTSEVYAFALVAYYMIYGEQLFTKQNQQEYLNNQYEFLYRGPGLDHVLLEGTIKKCLQTDPAARPTFTFLEKEIFYYYFQALMELKSECSDKKALTLIQMYGTEEIVNHQVDNETKCTCLHEASMNDRPYVVKALLALNANPNVWNSLGANALMMHHPEGSLEFLTLLVEESKIDINQQFQANKTALDCKVYGQNQACGEYLRSKGGKCCTERYPAEWQQYDVEDFEQV